MTGCQGLRPDAHSHTVQSLAVDLGAVGTFAFLLRRDLKARDKQVCLGILYLSAGRLSAGRHKGQLRPPGHNLAQLGRWRFAVNMCVAGKLTALQGPDVVFSFQKNE